MAKKQTAKKTAKKAAKLLEKINVHSAPTAEEEQKAQNQKAYDEGVKAGYFHAKHQNPVINLRERYITAQAVVDSLRGKAHLLQLEAERARLTEQLAYNELEYTKTLLENDSRSKREPSTVSPRNYEPTEGTCRQGGI